MPVALPQTTAELLLRAAEGVALLGPDVETDDIATFLSGKKARAEAALQGAAQLDLVGNGRDNDHWTARPLARLSAQATPDQKTTLLKFQLERFAPYAVFRDRILAGEAPVDAARQACLIHGLTNDPTEAEETLTGLGLYSGGLAYGENRALLVTVDPHVTERMRGVQKALMAEKDTVHAHIVQQLGVDAASFATGEIADFLVDSYMMILVGEKPYEDAMFLLGKGLEAWLKKLPGLDPQLVVPQGTSTMGAMAQFLKGQNRLNSKHFQIVNAIIAVRNASDHSQDPEIGATWHVSKETAVAVSHLVWSTMRSYFASRSGNFTL